MKNLVRKVVSYSSSSALGGGVGAYLNKYGQTTVGTAYLLLHSSPLPRNLGRISTSQSSLPNPTISFPSSTNPHFLFLPRSDIAHKLQSAFSGSGSGYGGGGGGGFINPCSSSGGGGEDGYNDDEQRALFQVLGYLGRVLSGWFFRWIVTGDIQFPFVLLIKELVGGTAFFVLERVWRLSALSCSYTWKASWKPSRRHCDDTFIPAFTPVVDGGCHDRRCSGRNRFFFLVCHCCFCFRNLSLWSLLCHRLDVAPLVNKKILPLFFFFFFRPLLNTNKNLQICRYLRNCMLLFVSQK